MDHFQTTTNLTNRILQDIMDLPDIETRVLLAKEFNQVRYDLFDILKKLKEAKTFKSENMLPDATIVVALNSYNGKLNVVQQSVDDYCKHAFGDGNKFNSEVYMVAHGMLNCFMNVDGKFITTEVCFSNISIDTFVIPKFIVRME